MAEILESGKVEESAPQKPPTGGFRLMEISGIKITIDYSWIIVFLLVIWSLSAGYFPLYFPGYSQGLYWFSGLIATILFFSSILIHELSHSLTAIRAGIAIPEITLFLFGGVAHLSKEVSDPKTELKIAIAGPLSSFALAGIFWAIKNALQGPGLVYAIFDYLAWINIALAVFNLVPGFPLDGGRILRAFVWWKTGSIATGTKWASDIGKGFAWALMILGGLQIFSGALIGGLWLLFIGMFLRGLAAGGYKELMARQLLEGARVDQVMVVNIVSIPAETTLEEAANKFFLRYGHGGFPVTRNGAPIGVVTLAELKDVPENERPTRTVEQVMMPLSPSIEISRYSTLIDALKKMTTEGVGRLLVVENNQIVGMITKTGLLRFLEIKRILDH